MVLTETMVLAETMVLDGEMVLGDMAVLDEATILGETLSRKLPHDLCWSERGQMTVELAVCIPVLIAVSLVVFNAMLFLGHCASFDRLAKDAVRTFAAAPAHGQTPADCAALVQQQLRASFPEDYLNVTVNVAGGGAAGTALGFATYTATLSFTPTLFGRDFSGAAYGVAMGSVEHRTQLVVDPYRPGAIA